MWKDNIEHNSWYNVEDQGTNRFKRKRESVRDFFEWKKNDVIKSSNKNSEWLKDLMVDSKLLDMEKWSELSDSEIDTKEQLDQLFEQWKKNKKDVLNHKELSWEILHNYERFQNRSPEVVEQISTSAAKIEDEIKNWKKEENPIARFLLKMANWLNNGKK